MKRLHSVYNWYNGKQDPSYLPAELLLRVIWSWHGLMGVDNVNQMTAK